MIVVYCSHISIKPTHAHVCWYILPRCHTSTNLLIPPKHLQLRSSSWPLLRSFLTLASNSPKNSSAFLVTVWASLSPLSFAKSLVVAIHTWWAHWALAEEVAAPRHHCRCAESASVHQPEEGDSCTFVFLWVVVWCVCWSPGKSPSSLVREDNIIFDPSCLHVNPTEYPFKPHPNGLCCASPKKWPPAAHGPSLTTEAPRGFPVESSGTCRAAAPPPACRTWEGL